MELFLKIVICFVAGAGAGIGTGFAGMSAAAVIGPMLSVCLGLPAYTAVGIGLASDVLASAVSAVTYRKNKNLDLKNGLLMMVFVLLFTVVGSYAASHLPDSTMGNFTIFAMMLIGLRFLLRPVMTTRAQMESVSRKKRILGSVLGGALVGFICGFVGAGGGMMMLFVLTTFLGYELHMAVGTSVLIMSFTAFTGSLSHFFLGDAPDLLVLALCALFTLVFAWISSFIANKSGSKTLNRVVGGVLVVLGALLLVIDLCGLGAFAAEAL